MGKVIAPGANDGSNDGETVTTTAAPISPRPPATVLPTRLVGQQLKLVGLSLSQVQANLNEIRVGIAKALNVANDDVLIASVSSQQRRRRRLNQGAVCILYKVKVLDDDAVAKMKTRIRSVVVQAKIKKEIIEVIPNVAQSDVSMSSTEPTSEVYNPNPVTTRLHNITSIGGNVETQVFPRLSRTVILKTFLLDLLFCRKAHRT